MIDVHPLLTSVTTIGMAAAVALYVIAICVLSEYIAPIERYTLKQRIPGALMQVVGIALSTAIILSMQSAWKILSIEPFLIPLWDRLSPLGIAGFVLQIGVLLLITDFLRYWRHRAEHKWFWSIHAVHQAPTELHAANSIGHPLQAIPELLFVAIPLSFIQFDGPATPATVFFLVSFLTFYIHSPTNIHFGPLRAVVVDNRFHRIHHSLEERHFDKNFGICFSLWDGLFGTAHWPARDEWPKVGVEGVTPPKTVGDFLMMPLSSTQAESADNAAKTRIMADS